MLRRRIASFHFYRVVCKIYNCNILRQNELSMNGNESLTIHWVTFTCVEMCQLALSASKCTLTGINAVMTVDGLHKSVMHWPVGDCIDLLGHFVPYSSAFVGLCSFISVYRLAVIYLSCLDTAFFHLETTWKEG